MTLNLVDVPVPSGTAEALLSLPPTGSGPGVLLYMDVIGVRPQIAAMCDRIASWGYVVLAPNVFHRDGTVAELAPTGDLTDPEERQAYVATAMGRLRAHTPDQVALDAPAYLDHLASLDAVTGPALGATGYCMGAGMAVRAATGSPGRVLAVGGFHGARLATDDTESPHLGLTALVGSGAAFCFGHADDDPSMPPDSVAMLGSALAASGLEASNEVYAGAPHGFSMADTSAYHEGAAERMYAELRALLDERLLG
ncbi:MAG: dienelactone hydrolase [Nocardioides sp.]|nr:dienelactone hydrolase [Nocardioides sp.]